MEEKTYIIECEDKTKKKITVPADWKVTFGPAVKGNNSGTRNPGAPKIPMALRFYETETKQRAIFTDVVSFRDASIKIEVEKIKTEEKEGYMECDGVRKKTLFQASVKEWVNPDEDANTNKQLPAPPTDAEMFSIKSTLDRTSIVEPELDLDPDYEGHIVKKPFKRKK